MLMSSPVFTQPLPPLSVHHFTRKYHTAVLWWPSPHFHEQVSVSKVSSWAFPRGTACCTVDSSRSSAVAVISVLHLVSFQHLSALSRVEVSGSWWHRCAQDMCWPTGTSLHWYSGPVTDPVHCSHVSENYNYHPSTWAECLNDFHLVALTPIIMKCLSGSKSPRSESPTYTGPTAVHLRSEQVTGGHHFHCSSSNSHPPG